MTHLTFRILHKPQDDSLQFKEFIKYETLDECIKYLENVNKPLRPAMIVTGQRVVRAYDWGIIDYEYINMIERENQELRDGLWEIKRKTVEVDGS